MRRAVLGQIAGLIWVLGRIGLDPMEVSSIPLRVICSSAAVVLLVGSLPGRPIWRGETAIGPRAVPWMVVAFPVGLPPFLMVNGVRMAVDSYYIYHVEQDLPALWSLTFDVGLITVQFLSLCVSLATLFARRKPGSAGGSAA